MDDRPRLQMAGSRRRAPPRSIGPTDRRRRHDRGVLREERARQADTRPLLPACARLRRISSGPRRTTSRGSRGRSCAVAERSVSGSGSSATSTRTPSRWRSRGVWCSTSRRSRASAGRRIRFDPKGIGSAWAPFSVPAPTAGGSRRPGSARVGRQILESLAASQPVDVAGAVPRIEAAVADALGHVRAHALPYFDRVSEWARHPARLAADEEVIP